MTILIALDEIIVMRFSGIFGGALIMAAQAQEAPMPLSPEDSRDRMRLPAGFRMELIASEPLVEEPTCLAFDASGRLFVCELHGYNIEGHLDASELNARGETDRSVRRIRWEFLGGEIAERAAALQYGKLKLLLDHDRDGRMDEAVVWADDLPPAYGVVPYRDGVIVTCAPDIIYFADDDRDGRPDRRETLFTGFEVRTLERGVNNPRWGMDHWIYVGGGGEGGRISGPRLANAVELPAGDFRIRPDGSAIEPVNGRVGTYGLALHDNGDRFPSSGGTPAIYALPAPRRYFERNPFVSAPGGNYSASDYHRGFRISAPHPWRTRRAEDPRWVAFYGERETNSHFFSGGCGNEFYSGALFPADYVGDLFYCEPSLNLIHRCVITADGAGYQGRRAASEMDSEFLASTDGWFRPMNLRVGPMGGLFVVDMYREIIEDYSAIPRYLQQEYGLDKGDDRGRIWRLTPEDAPAFAPDSLERFSTEMLMRELGSPNRWRRIMAQRLLVRRGSSEWVTLCRETLKASGVSDLGVAHGMYALEAVDALRREDLIAVMGSGGPISRRHALRFVDRWRENDLEILEAVLARVDDPDPAVRLQVALTLGEFEDERVAEALFGLARDRGDERWMRSAILSSAHREVAGSLLQRLIEVESEAAIFDREAWFSDLGATVVGHGSAEGVAGALTAAERASNATQKAVLMGLVRGVSSVSSKDALELDAANWEPYLRSAHAPTRIQATRLAARTDWRARPVFKEATQAVARWVVDASRGPEIRNAGLVALAEIGYPELTSIARGLVTPNEPMTLQLSAIDALAGVSGTGGAELLVAAWRRSSPAVQRAIVETLIRSAEGSAALLAGVSEGRIPENALSSTSWERLEGSGDAEIAAIARQLRNATRGSGAADREEILEPYLEALSDPGDIAQGAELFARFCGACHSLDDNQPGIGPSLADAVSGPAETMLADILFPNDRIDPKQRQYFLTDRDGNEYAGIVVRESATSLTLGLLTGERRDFLRREIRGMRPSENSLMPENLRALIPPDSMRDLLRFLREMGP